MKPVESDDRKKLDQAIFDAIGDEHYASDIERNTRLTFDLALSANRLLNEHQMTLLELSRRCLGGDLAETERLEALGEAIHALDAINALDDREPEQAASHLLFASLVRNTGLEVEWGDLAADLAITAGVPLTTVAAIFERHVPEFKNPFRSMT